MISSSTRRALALAAVLGLVGCKEEGSPGVADAEAPDAAAVDAAADGFRDSVEGDPRFAGLMVTQLVIEDGWLAMALGPQQPQRTAWRSDVSSTRMKSSKCCQRMYCGSMKGAPVASPSAKVRFSASHWARACQVR